MNRATGSNSDENGERYPISLEYVFKYFEMHASQRISIFNFYVALSSLMVGAIGAAYQIDGIGRIASSVAASGLIFISFVFWKLDSRTQFLIKHAETALAQAEHGLPDFARLVGSEDAKFKSSQTDKTWIFRAISYGKSFRIMYAATAMFGALSLFVIVP